jgi:hypothetical protein
MIHTFDDWMHVTNAADNRLDKARKGGRSITIAAISQRRQIPSIDRNSAASLYTGSSRRRQVDIFSLIVPRRSGEWWNEKKLGSARHEIVA